MGGGSRWFRKDRKEKEMAGLIEQKLQNRFQFW